MMAIAPSLSATSLKTSLSDLYFLGGMALTAALNPEDQDLCFQSGMVELIPKPLQKKKLHDTVIKYIEQSKKVA
jgi:CheY-like chemotaxis protein